MALKQYEYRGYTYQFEEGKAPAGAILIEPAVKAVTPANKSMTPRNKTAAKRK